MPITALTLLSDVATMSGGSAAVTGTGEQHDFVIGGTWAAGDTITVVFQDVITGFQISVGAGNITGKSPTFAFTFNDKEYLLAGDTTFFSAVGTPEDFDNSHGINNGYVKLTNHYASPEALTAMASFQGRLVFFSRQTAQIWSAPSDPTAWALQKIFEFLGTRSPESVRTVGDFDVFFLDETGVRSLRAKETTQNAYADDLGSPIDEIVQAALVASSDAQKDAACGIVEPASKRYWLFLKDTIYVFSTFPSSKIAAWSKYSPTYSSGGVQTAFVPQKFVTFKGRVYCRDANSFYLYGGSDNNTYDNCVATWETPYMDAKTPANIKESKGVNVVSSGAWQVQAGMDPVSAILSTILERTGSTYDEGIVPFSERGTHVKIKGLTTGSTAAKVSALTWLYEMGDER